MYKFIMSIGDWSDDGHGLHDDYTIKSNKPVETVREAHYTIKEKTGVDIENICCEYQNSRISNDDFNKLTRLGFTFPGPDEKHLTPETMAKMWVFLLNKTDPSLKLTFTAENELPTLHFYGYDDKGRHIDQIGYGCFD